MYTSACELAGSRQLGSFGVHNRRDSRDREIARRDVRLIAAGRAARSINPRDATHRATDVAPGSRINGVVRSCDRRVGVDRTIVDHARLYPIN